MKQRMLSVPIVLGAIAVFAPGEAAAGIASNCGGKGGFNCSIPTLVGGASGNSLRKDNKLFAGINWNFGKSGAELVVGVRHLRVQSNKDVEGAKLDFTMPFSSSGISFDKLRLRYVNGTRDVQGELGGGFSFMSGKPLLAAEVQGPYVLAGLDFLIGGGFQPYVGVNSLGKPKLPVLGTNGQLTCPQGVSLVAASDVGGVDPADQLQGFTCVQPIAN